jgi:hypothetical protein
MAKYSGYGKFDENMKEFTTEIPDGIRHAFWRMRSVVNIFDNTRQKGREWP